MDNTCGRVSAVESASDSPAIAVVGTGRVASALVRTISEGGFCRLRQYGRSGDVLPLGQLAHDASDGLDAVVVAVADSAVAAVAEQLGRLEGDYRVCPGHGRLSSLALERDVNPYVRQALCL